MFSQIIGDIHDGSKTVNFDDLMQTKVDKNLITSFFIILFAYAVQFMTFPLYVDLENRSTERFSQVIWGATIFYSIVYLALGIIGAFMFGENLQADFLINMATRDGILS